MLRTLFLSLMVLVLRTPSLADEPFRIGIAGMTHGHVAGLLSRARERDDLEIVGVWEPDTELFNRYARHYGLDPSIRFDDLGEMLDHCQPEAVSGMGTIRSHLSVVQACAPRHLPVLLEKPLAFAISDADQILTLSRQTGTPILTNYETSWYASVREAKEIIHSGTYGDPFRMVFRHGHRGPREIGCGEEFVGWLSDPEENGGGAVVDFGCYGAVLATFIMDGQKPTSVQAVRRQIKKDQYPQVDDDATILLTYPKATAVIQASWNWPHDLKEMDVHMATATLYAGKWDQLTLRKSGEAAPQSINAPPLQPYGDEWTYLRAVTRDQAPIDPLSSLDWNHTVVEILDQARKAPLSEEPHPH
ncbi:putative dehydrogenase [Haloferula luteola]|uniref:Putative dehydrogenase n=1 Tax=Haloferula luteola TaxID=595692 RepID=A0A840V4S8_9BACT|nr:Gfo/Idh/MocA family oxidoreductase [Haloferula luteola]MBB5353277.1 putative dehydrogenase [Haloferula luteola]